MNVLLVKALANGLKAWRRCQTLDGWLLQWRVRVSRFWRTICESSVLYPLPMTKTSREFRPVPMLKKSREFRPVPMPKISREFCPVPMVLHASTRTTLIQLRTRILWSATRCMIFLSSAYDL